MSLTKERLLDSAERLFSRQGFSETSVRQITAAAKANLAALNYHFGFEKGPTLHRLKAVDSTCD